jgi:hypothetical protein
MVQPRVIKESTVARQGLAEVRESSIVIVDLRLRHYTVPQISPAVSTIEESLAHCSVSVSTFPSSVLAKPH